MQIPEKVKAFVAKIFTKPLYYWSLVLITFVTSRIGTWLYPFDSDHWIFFYVGKNWFRGGSLYVTAWDHKPPMIFLINGLLSLVGDDLFIHRVIITLFALLDIYLFYLLARMLAPKLAGAKAELFAKISLLIYVVWRNLMHFTSSGNNNENFGLIFYIGMLLGYFSYREDKKWWKLVLSGLCFSVLFYMKGNFLLLAAPVGIMLLVDGYKDLWKFVKEALLYGAPLLVMTGIWLGYFASKGTVSEFIFASLTFSAKYSTSAWKGDLSNLAIFYVLVAFASPLFVAVPLLAAAKAWQNRLNHEYIFLTLAVIFGSIAFFGVGVPYPYYFLILMPAYSLLVGYILCNRNSYSRFTYLAFVLVFGFGVLINAGYSSYQTYKNQVSHVYTEAQEYREIAAYVEANSEVGDKVFTADYGATFYQLAHRGSGSRFISASVLLLDYRDGYGFNLDDIFISDMEKSKAKYVVVYKERNSLYYKNKPLVEYLDANYHPEKTFTTFVLHRRN